MKTRSMMFVAVLAFSMLILAASAARAADQPSDKAAAQAGCDAVPKCWKVVENGKDVVKCDTTRICGKPHAPQAVYLLPRATPVTPGAELSESFIPKIIKSVREEPF
ncbi:MAG: hypothetical protein HY897_16830 [Deltaproteobacteria bacterium]|nr:hypothetical protein [Deltaproteobacteria bacterium]